MRTEKLPTIGIDMKIQFDIAGILMKQIDKESSQCSFWMVSAIERMANFYPEMKITELLHFIASALPERYEWLQVYRLKCNNGQKENDYPLYAESPKDTEVKKEYHIKYVAKAEELFSESSVQKFAFIKGCEWVINELKDKK